MSAVSGISEWFGCYSGDLDLWREGGAVLATARKIRFKKWPFENWTKWLMLLPCTDPRPRHTSRTAEESWLEATHTHSQWNILKNTHSRVHVCVCECLSWAAVHLARYPHPWKALTQSFTTHAHTHTQHTHSHTTNSYDVRDPHPLNHRPSPPLVLMGRRNWVRPLKESS